MEMALKAQHQSNSIELERSVIGKRDARATKIRQITHKTVPKVS